MRTKSITLFYQLTQEEIYPPRITDLERKERWIKELQKTVEASWKPLIVKVKYEIYNPEIEKQRNFFNGAVVLYYCIQNEDMTVGLPANDIVKQYRELILDEVLGFDAMAVKKTIRKRKSTKDFKTVQAWNNFLSKLKEDMFDSSGYEFPDSEEFWESVKENGYESAKKIAIERLQKSLLKKLNT